MIGIRGDAYISKGTPNYRAPEVAKEKCRDPHSADIYCAGLVLFNLKYGHLPFFEDVDGKEDFIEHSMLKKYMKEPHHKEEVELLDLFSLMTHPDAILRGNMDEIKRHKWFTRPIYNEKEAQFILEMHFNENKPLYSSPKGASTICLE